MDASKLWAPLAGACEGLALSPGQKASTQTGTGVYKYNRWEGTQHI